MYGMMCEDKYLAIVREERDCLVDLERDLELRQCFLNRTNILRDETNSRKIPFGHSQRIPHPSPTHRSLSAASPIHSYECSVIQAYVDCLLEREIDSCADAVKVEVSLLSLLATRDGSNCNLLTNNTKSKPPPLEVCDRNGDCECRLSGYVYDKESRKCIGRRIIFFVTGRRYRRVLGRALFPEMYQLAWLFRLFLRRAVLPPSPG